MRQALRRLENMDCSRHSHMYQTDQLEIAGRWKVYRVTLTGCRGCGGHARCVVEAGSIGCTALTLTSDESTGRGKKRRPYLARCQKADRMDFVSAEGPPYAVAGV